MKTIIAVGITLSGLFTTMSIGPIASAKAQQMKVSAPAPEVPPLGRWSLGAGVGFSGTGDVGLAGLEGLNGFAGSSAGPARSQTPYGTEGAEVALSPVFRLVLGAQGSYAKQLSRERDPETEHIIGRGPEGDFRWSLGGAIGGRAVLNPGGVVEVSPILMLGGFRHVSETTYQSGSAPELSALLYTNRRYSSVGWDARLGLVLEYSAAESLPAL